MPESNSSSSSDSSDSEAESHLEEVNDLLQQVAKLTTEKHVDQNQKEKPNVTIGENLSFTEFQYKGEDSVTKEFKTSSLF